MKHLIIDNFLDKTEIKALRTEIYQFSFRLTSSNSDIKVHNFMQGDGQSKETLDMFLKICDLPQVSVESGTASRALQRYYLNIAPPGDWYAGDFHIDDGLITALYYPNTFDNTDWKPEWGGATEFITGETVQYVGNRLLLFDASVEHRAAAHYYNEGWRVTLALKTNLIWNE